MFYKSFSQTRDTRRAVCGNHAALPPRSAMLSFTTLERRAIYRSFISTITFVNSDFIVLIFPKPELADLNTHGLHFDDDTIT